MVNQLGETGIAAARQVRQEMGRTVTRSRASFDVLLGRNEPEVGLTPKDTIYARGTLRLYRYRPQTDDVYRVPLVFVMSLISKSYILDLAPGQSLVEYLLKEGFDVYMIDWGVPRAEDHGMRLENYVLDLMPRCVEEVQRITKEQDYSFLGYCMGGLFGLMYAAAFPEAGLKNLASVSTPVDFEGMAMLRRWADPQWFDVDRIVDTFGNVPAELVRMSIEALRPLDRILGYVRLWDNLWNEEYVYNWRIRYNWVNDQIPFPGECYRQLIKDLLLGNKLKTGELSLGGRRIDLKNVRCAVLNAMAEHDHITPYESTRALISLVGSCDKQEMLVKGGHVSLVSGKNAILRLWPTVNQWLAPRSV